MTISPEILAEQVMGYVVGASELIPTLKPSSKLYDMAILPQGPHFYTWLLQAAGYLLLDGEKKKMLIVSEQAEDPKEIMVDSNGYGPVFGQRRRNSITDVAVLAHQLDAKISRPDQGSLSESLRFQLPFLRVITVTETLLHIGIGKELPQTKTKRLISRIRDHMHDHAIVLLANIGLAPDTKKADEQQQLANAMKKSESGLIGIFQKTLGLMKKKPEIVAYVDPGDFGVGWAPGTRYACIVG